MRFNYRYLVFPALFALLCAGQVAAQDSYEAWAAAGKPDLGLAGGTAPQGGMGGLTQFADQASFDAETGGGLPLETFDNGLTGPAAVNTCNDTINSTTTGPCFNAGDLIPGFSVTFVDNGDSKDARGISGGVVALGDQFLGASQTTTVVGANAFLDNTEVTFDPPVTAVAFEAFGVAGDYLVTARAAGGEAIGSIIVTGAAADSGVFAGFTSALPVATVVVDGFGGTGEVIDNLQFGSASAPTPAVPVPTFGQYGLLFLAGLMLVAGVFSYRRFSA